MKVLVLQKAAVVDSQRDEIFAALSEIDDIEVALASSCEDALAHHDAQIIVAPTISWLPDALRGLPDVEWIHFLSAGVDPIWSMDFDKQRYALSKSTGVHTAPISEYVLGAIMFALKGFGRFVRQQQLGDWNRVWLEECTSKTVGIIGVGSIGSRVAGLAKQFGMNVVGAVHSPRPLPNVDHVFSAVELDGLLEVSDFVVILVPLTSTTRSLIGTEQLRRMRRSAWLINVSRGEILDEGALTEALQNGQIAGAILDVFESEPLPETSPLWSMENVLITPHVAGTTQCYMRRALNIFKDNLQRYLRDGSLTTPVSLRKGY